MQNINFDEIIKPDFVYEQNEQPLPQHPFHMLLSGRTGRGKTNYLMNLIRDVNWDRLYIFAPDLSEAKYDFLIKQYNEAERQSKKAGIMKTGDFYIKTASSLKDIPPINDIKKDKQNLVIFDDWGAEKLSVQRKIIDYFNRIRKRNASVVYLAQSYFATPSDIRRNCNFYIFFSIDNRKEIDNIYRDRGIGITLEEFRDFFQWAFAGEKGEKSYNFATIDLNAKDENMRYRRNLDCPLHWRRSRSGAFPA